MTTLSIYIDDSIFYFFVFLQILSLIGFLIVIVSCIVYIKYILKRGMHHERKRRIYSNL